RAESGLSRRGGDVCVRVGSELAREHAVATGYPECVQQAPAGGREFPEHALQSVRRPAAGELLSVDSPQLLKERVFLFGGLRPPSPQRAARYSAFDEAPQRAAR